LLPDPDKAGPSDPLNALEKQTDAKNYMQKVQSPRIDELQDASDNVNADPYTLSQRARKRFRAVKKEDQARTLRDTELKDRYSLPSEFALVREDDSTVADANSEWSKARAAAVEAESKRQKRTLEQPTRLSASRVVSAAGGKYSTSGLSTLGRRILDNTSRRSAVTQRRGAGP
jgi:coiled-coil domain-containing protein 130